MPITRLKSSVNETKIDQKKKTKIQINFGIEIGVRKPVASSVFEQVGTLCDDDDAAAWPD